VARPVAPDEDAEAVACLAPDEATAIAGQALNVDSRFRIE